MSKRQDLTNKVFGYLTVLRFSNVDKFGRSLWECLCICGEMTLVPSSDLNRGTTKSCGCMKGYLIALKTGIDPAELAYRTIYNDYKNRSKSHNYDFDFSFEQFKEFVTDCCFYCGTPPALEKTVSNKLGSATINYNGIDRKDNSLGYTASNCVTACKLCNYAKKAMSYDDFIYWLDKIVNFRR